MSKDAVYKSYLCNHLENLGEQYVDLGQVPDGLRAPTPGKPRKARVSTGVGSPLSAHRLPETAIEMSWPAILAFNVPRNMAR
jgi:hypothetical protein